MTISPSLVALVLLGIGCGGRAEAPALAASEHDGWQMGEQYAYRLHLVSRAGVDSTQAAFEFDLTGRLEVLPLEVEGAREIVLVRIVDARFAGPESDDVRARFDVVVTELGRWSELTYDSGIATEARLPQDASVMSVGILRNLAAAFQFSPQPVAAKATWKAHEHDATGRYVAEYARGSAPGEFAKKKLHYEALILDEKLEAQIFPIKGAMPRFEMSKGEIHRERGIPSRIHLEEELATVLTSTTPLKSRTSLDLEIVSREPAAAFERTSLDHATTLLKAEAPYIHASGRFDLDDAKIGGLSFDQIVSALETSAEQSKGIKLAETLNDEAVDTEDVAAGKAWMGRRNRFFTALAATFRKQPETIGRALAIVRSSSPASEALVSALGAAGTEDAQKGLLSLMADTKRSDKERKAAGFALVRTRVPTVFAARELERLLSDPYWKEYATYGLGTYARRLGEMGNTAELERIGKLLVQQLREAKGRPARLDALAGISNSGYPGALPAVRPFLRDGDPVIRSAAVIAIRLMKHSEVDALIIERLGNDTAAEVRVAAVQAARNREPSGTLGEALSQRALADENARVRMQALKLAIQWRDDLPGLSAALAQVAQREQDSTIRRLAGAAHDR